MIQRFTSAYLKLIRDSFDHDVQDTASIAALPLIDMSPEKNQEYFSDGLTEELMSGLAKDIPEILSRIAQDISKLPTVTRSRWLFALCFGFSR